MGMSAAHCQGNVRNFRVSGEWSPCFCTSRRGPKQARSGIAVVGRLICELGDLPVSKLTASEHWQKMLAASVVAMYSCNVFIAR